MSVLTGALGVGLALIAEEVIVTNKGGAGAVAGAFGLIARAVERFADPTVPAIPDLADKNGPPLSLNAPNPATGGPVPQIGHTTPSGVVAPFAAH